MIIGGEGYVGSALKERGIKVPDDTLLYLAFMSNNDMCERNPQLASSLNHHAFEDVLNNIKVRRVIFASSVAVYGEAENAVESAHLAPTTVYGKQKKACEEILQASGLDYTIVRSASVCGQSPRMRYDLMVNRMVRDAAKTGKITVNGGEQMRSHIHIADLCRFYQWLIENPQPGQILNVVCENQSVMDTARLVAATVGKTEIEVKPYTDNRSYTVCGDKVKNIGFECRSSIETAIIDVYLNTLYL